MDIKLKGLMPSGDLQDLPVLSFTGSQALSFSETQATCGLTYVDVVGEMKLHN